MIATLAPLILSAVALLPLGSIAVDFARENHACRMELEATRITDWLAALPPPRTTLTPVEETPPVVVPIVAGLVPVPAPVVAELGGGGRHRFGQAVGTTKQRARWDSPTGQFWLIVANNADLEEPCSHCADPEDWERPHEKCPGCACPCGALEVVAHVG